MNVIVDTPHMENSKYSGDKLFVEYSIKDKEKNEYYVYPESYRYYLRMKHDSDKKPIKNGIKMTCYMPIDACVFTAITALRILGAIGSVSIYVF